MASSTLLDLSADTLELLTSIIPAQLIGKLWLCGSKKLNIKLSEGGGLRSFYFTPRARALWPKLVSNLPRLCSFSFICDFGETICPVTASEILSLSPSVRNLDLGFPGVLKVCTEALLTNLDHFKHLKQLTLRPGCFEKSVDLVPELLHNLPWDLEALDLRALPDLSSSEAEPFPFESVPQTLTSLGASTSRLETDSLATLPPTLTKLHIRVYSGNGVEWMKLLPRCMVDCEIVHVNAANVPEQDWNQLPRSLTYLAFSYPHSLKVEQVAGLPRGLLLLSIVESQTSDVAVVEALPPNLQGLFGFFKEPISAPQAKALPRTLISIHTDVSWHALSYLPSGIKNVNTTYQKNAGEPPVSLPKGLQEFYVDGSILSSEVPTLPEGLKIFQSAFKFLPLRLMQIQYSRWAMITHWCSSSSKILPRTLTELHLGPCRFESGWGRGLPSGLKTLRLQVDQIERSDVSDISETCTGITSFSLMIQKVTPSRTSFSDLIDVLPRETVLLAISFDEGNDKGLQDHHLQGLPPKLVSFCAGECPNLSLACTPYLPKSLRYFTMDFCTPYWFHPMP